MPNKNLEIFLESYVTGVEPRELQDDKKPSGYWRNWDNLSQELLRIKRDLGHFPSASELIKLQLSGVSTAIVKYHGGFRKVKEKLGESNSRKPDGYWKQWDNVEYELNKVINCLGHFPTQRELCDLDHQSLVYAISNFGGLNNIRKKLGYEEKAEKPTGYWRKWEHVKTALSELEKKIGHFPTDSELKELNGTLGGALRLYHGGIRKVREKLGKKNPRIQYGHYKKWKNVNDEIEKIVEDTGEFPTQDYLCKNGFGPLNSGIIKYHKGLTEVRKKMGYSLSTREDGYWRDFDNVKKEIQEAIEKCGHFPTLEELEKLGKGSLPQLIKDYHDLTMNDLREITGHTIVKRSAGYWNKNENIDKELKKVIKDHELTEFPTYSQLINLGYNAVAAAVSIHGGYNEARKRFGAKIIKIDNKKWQDINFTLEQAKKFLLEHPEYQTLPRAGILKDYEGGVSLTYAIVTYHGGFSEFRKLLGEKPKRVKNGHYHILENCATAVIKVMESEGLTEIPSLNEMIRKGYSGMAKPIQQIHGGYETVRKAVVQRINSGEENNLETFLQQYLGEKNE